VPREPLIMAASSAAADVSAALGTGMDSSASAAAHSAAMRLAAAACGVGRHPHHSSAAAAADAQWWAVAGLFAILVGGSLGMGKCIPPSLSSDSVVCSVWPAMHVAG
jgi:hypothetical protein